MRDVAEKIGCPPNASCRLSVSPQGTGCVHDWLTRLAIACLHMSCFAFSGALRPQAPQALAALDPQHSLVQHLPRGGLPRRFGPLALELRLHACTACRFPSPPTLARHALTGGGTLATKAAYFGVKSTNVFRGEMCTKPAKVGRLASTLLKYVSSAQRRPSSPPPHTPPASSLRGRTKVAKVGPLRTRVKNLLKSDRPLTSTTPTRASATNRPLMGLQHPAPRVAPSRAHSAAQEQRGEWETVVTEAPS